MSDINVEICSACAANIKNHHLHKFWRILCLGSITCREWACYDPSDHLYEKYIEILESKRFLVTYETPTKIYFKTLGIHVEDNDEYLICLKPYEHFKERFTIQN